MSLLGPLIFALVIVHQEGHKIAKRDTLVRFEDVKQTLNSWKQSVDADMAALRAKIQQSSLPPVGFIYIQYGSQSAPSALWPAARWKSVTDQYAGAFFRAEGGHSLPFGNNQRESMRTLEFEYQGSGIGWRSPSSMQYDSSAIITTGGRSGTWNGFRTSYMQKDVPYAVRDRDNEVRPFNQAIRIWKRIP